MKVSVFLDGANFYYMQKHLGWHICPKKVLQYIEREVGEIADAFYYIGRETDPVESQQNFLDALPEMGYSLVTKPVKHIHDDATGTIKKKANLDIEIVLDMFNTIDSFDCAVLISGDGDFDRALELLKSRGKQMRIIACDGLVAHELRAVAGRHYIGFEEIRKEVEKA